MSGQPIIVYNNETFPVASIAEVMVGDTRNYQVSGPDGKRVPSQVIRKDGKNCLLFEAKVPSTGFAVYSMKPSGNAPIVRADASQRQIESSRYVLTVDNHGDIRVGRMEHLAGHRLQWQQCGGPKHLDDFP